MNSKGLFCFLIVLAFAGMHLNFLSESIAARGALGKAKAIAMEAEQMHAIRAGIEINADSVVGEALRAGLLQNKGPGEIKSSVNGKLLQFFKAVEGGYGGRAKINFYAGSASPSQEFMEENSTVSVIRPSNHAIAAEYTFTGGLLKSREIVGEIGGERTRQFFKIPAGYTVRAVVSG